MSGSGAVVGNAKNSGEIDVGGVNSAGILTIQGNYSQTSTGVLNIDLGGTTAGTQYDELVITAAATLAGTLNLDLINGFVPASGDSFKILTTSSLSGTFDTVTGADLGNGHKLTPQYNTTNVTLVVG